MPIRHPVRQLKYALQTWNIRNVFIIVSNKSKMQCFCKIQKRYNGTHVQNPARHQKYALQTWNIRSVFWNLTRNHPEVLLGKYVLKICSKFTREHSCQSAIWMKLHCKFIEIALRHGCTSLNLLHISRTPFPKNTYELLNLI